MVSDRSKGESWKKSGAMHWQHSLIRVTVHSTVFAPKAGSSTPSKIEAGGEGDWEVPF